jgi:hypothetical protein
MAEVARVLWRFLSLDWVPVAGLAVLGVMYAAMSTRVGRVSAHRGLATSGRLARR